MDWNISGSFVFGISQARILKWVAISFSRGSSWPRDWTCVSVGWWFLYHWATREALIYIDIVILKFQSPGTVLKPGNAKLSTKTQIKGHFRIAFPGHFHALFSFCCPTAQNDLVVNTFGFVLYFIIEFYLLSSVSSVAQLCPTLCDPMDCSLPRSSVHGISQARILKWVAVPSLGHLSDPGIELTSLMYTCIGRWVL